MCVYNSDSDSSDSDSSKEIEWN